MDDKFYPNDNLFFLVISGKIVVWDYKHHNQYEIELPYFKRLLELSSKEPSFSSKEKKTLDKILLENRLIKKKKSINNDWGWDILSKIFHIGTKNTPEKYSKKKEVWAKDYVEHCKDVCDVSLDFFNKKKGPIISLPPPNLSLIKKPSFLNVIQNRMTCRDFKSKFIDIDYLSTLLFVSFGALHAESSEFEKLGLMNQFGIRKASASGGRLHSNEAYVIIFKVKNINPGVYYYDWKNHKLIFLKKKILEDQLVDLLSGQFYAKGLSLGVFLTNRFDKIWWKYPHSRGYRIALLDTGHTSQTFQLCATALGLNTWISGAFRDSKVEKLLGIDGKKEAAIFFLGAGKANRVSIDPYTATVLKESVSI